MVSLLRVEVYQRLRHALDHSRNLGTLLRLVKRLSLLHVHLLILCSLHATVHLHLIVRRFWVRLHQIVQHGARRVVCRP